MIAEGSNIKPLFTGKAVLLVWTLVTVISWSINVPILFTAFLGAAGRTLFDTEFGYPYLMVWVTFGTIAGVMAGIIAGITQWLVLRTQTNWAGQWLRNSILGWIVSWGFVFGVFALARVVQLNLATKIPQFIILSIILGCGGVIIGCSQWIVLRQYTIRTGWWLLMNAVVLPTGIMVGSFVTRRGPNDIFDFILWGGIAGLIIGIATGGVMVWLLQYQKLLPE